MIIVSSVVIENGDALKKHNWYLSVGCFYRTSCVSVDSHNPEFRKFGRHLLLFPETDEKISHVAVHCCIPATFRSVTLSRCRQYLPWLFTCSFGAFERGRTFYFLVISRLLLRQLSVRCYTCLSAGRVAQVGIRMTENRESHVFLWLQKVVVCLVSMSVNSNPGRVKSWYYVSFIVAKNLELVLLKNQCLFCVLLRFSKLTDKYFNLELFAHII